MSHSQGNHKTIGSTLIVRLSILLVLMFGTLGATQAQWASPSPGITATTDNVGIGIMPTGGPSYPLHVVGASGQYTVGVFNPTSSAGNSFGLFMAAGGNSSDFAVRIRDFNNSTELFAVRGDGKVGIGTTSPQELLDVSGNIKVHGSGIAGIGFGDSASSLTAGGLYLVRANAAMSSAGNVLHVGGYNGIAFRTGDTPGSPGTPTMYITDTGKVGIGTPTPANMLDVNGTISGNNIIAKFQDVAEWVPSSEQLLAGTVVVLDSTKSNQVTSSPSVTTRVWRGLSANNPA